MRSPTGLVKNSRARLSRALVFAAVFFVGGGEGALALLPTDPERSGPRPPHRAATLASVTAAPTRLEPGPGVAGRGGRDYYRRTASRHVAASAERSFMPLYREAARTFGVSWRLIASIHRQETAFSAEPSTYHGLNAFGCCAGPMQFNVSNGPPSTWQLYRDAFRQGRRPRSYPHRTRSHPSVYDDFDAMMAAAALLRDAGAGEALAGGAWAAAYAYYGHDLFGIDYANQVMGRAQAWEIYGFCVNCALDEVLVGAFDAAFGDEARRQLLAADREKDEEERKKRRDKKAGKKPKKRAADPQRPADPRPAPAPPETETTPSPEPEPAAPPPVVTEPPAQPVAPPPPHKECTKIERLLGCG